MWNINGRWFTDEEGRVLLLRGVNVSGSCKLPFTPFIPSHLNDQDIFLRHRHLSFVGRPFPLNEASDHFRLLRSWGMNFLRFCITWEAIEHAGPGIYDYEYIAYVVEVLKVAKSFGFKVFIDPHQDVWSRFTGGSGAPGWTLELAGFDLRYLMLSEAAILQNMYNPPLNYPKMIWTTNYWKLACATMFTLFFGGAKFAPQCCIDGVNIQEYLQSHFINSVSELAKAIVKADLHDSVVVGYDTLNEPSNGYIGHLHLNEINEEQQSFRLGMTPTPFESMQMGEGISVKVANYHFTWYGPANKGRVWGNPVSARAWNENRRCVWAHHGVWDIESATLLKPNYFAFHPDTGNPVDFLYDFWKPFANRFGTELRKIHSNAIIFLEPSVLDLPPVWEPTDIQNRLVYAPHWYDGVTLVNKKFNFWNIDIVGVKRGQSYLSALALGYKSIVKCFINQLKCIKEEGLTRIGEVPCIMGEFGIPMDMDQGRAFASGDYSAHEKALNANYIAMEENLLNCTLWTYVSDNSHKWGDNWNGEDLSVVTRGNLNNDIGENSSTAMRAPENSDHAMAPGSESSMSAGDGLMGRVQKAFVRPYAMKTSGIPLSMQFDMNKGIFRYYFHNDRYAPVAGHETVIFVPEIHFGSDPDQLKIIVSDGTYTCHLDKQLVLYKHSELGLKEHFIWISKKSHNRKQSSVCTMF